MAANDRLRQKRQQGAAMLITALGLTLMSLLAFTAIRHSEQESSSGGRSRAATRALYAADAGVELALIRLQLSPPDLDPIDETLGDGAVLQSRSRTETVAGNLGQVGIGASAEGYAVNVGSGVANLTRVFQVNVTASEAGSTAEVEAKLARTSVDETGY